MNNIYKVIWSKAKNCYVVASEIAKSHTKSASGSEKIGGGTRRALLASLMAVSLLCGGLGVASASLEVVDQSGTAGTVTIYTKDEVDNALTAKGSAADVASNKTDITNLKSAVGDAGSGLTKDVADQKADIATNRANINNLDGKLANLTTTVSGKADEAAVTTLEGRVGGVEGKVTALETTVGDASGGLVKDVAELKAQGTTLNTELGNKANQSDLDAAKNRITTNEGNITDLQKKTAKLSDDGKELTGMTTVSGTTVSGTTVEAGALKVTGGISNGAGVTTTLADIKASMTQTATNKGDIAALQTKTGEQQTAINGLNEKTTQISYDAAKGTTVNGVDFMAQEVDAHGKGLTGVSTLNTTGAATIGGALTAAGVNAGTEAITGGSLSVTGEVKGNRVDAGAGEIKTTGVVNAGTLSTAGNATVGGDLKVTGTITTDKMVFGETPNNYTEIDHGKVTSKNLVVNGAGETISSSSTFDVEKNEVGFTNTATGDHSYHKQTAKGINGYVTDKDGNKTYTKVTATENSFQVQDKDGKNKNHQVNTKDSSVTEITNAAGATTKTEQTATDIINTAKDGTIKNEANHIENTATTMKTTVTGQATEEFNGGLNTTVTGAENHTVTGKQTNTVGDGQINNITGGQKNNILTGSQETTVSNGNISNTAINVTNEGTKSVTNKVGANEVKVSTDGVDIKAEDGKKITESVGTASRVVENDKITDKAGNSIVTTENGKGTTFGKEGSTDTTNIYGDSIKTGTIKAKDTTTDKLTAGAAAGADGGRLTVDATDGVKGSYKSGDYTSRSYILANTLKSGVDNDKDPTEDGFRGSRTDHYMDGDKAKLNETVKDADGSNVTNKTSTSTATTITDGTTTTKTEQDTKDITNTAKNGTITNDAKDIVTNASNSITEKVGETNVTTKTTTSSKSEIQNADTITSVQQTENMVQSYVGKKDGSATNVTTNFANASANMVTQDGQTSTVLNNKDGLLVRNTANGKSFNTADGTNTGSALEWTNVKGNEISTGKVEANYVKMDYADVMRNLGVRGNANINGKTTTGSLEVTGTSTLKGDVTMENNATVGNNLTVNGTTKTKTLSVTENATVGGTLDVTGKATFKDSVSIAKDLTVGGDVTAKSYKVGDKTYISADGINANNQKITNVADGSISEGSKDAVNGGQLYTVKNDLEGKVNKVGANAAAMANLHPMEFDPDSKWNIAAAIGNYGSETAAALGAFYRPNDDVMVNLSTAFGTGENMVGGGVSVRLGKGSNKLSREESNALKAQVNDLTARMDALLSVLNPNMSKDFPDVPENHWAYEAVSRLAGNDIVQGYPDGEFHGDRTMTRYEMAEIIYNALSRGAEAERELVEEFKPELQAMAASEKATAEKAEG